MAIVETSPRLVHEMIRDVRDDLFAVNIAGDQAVVYNSCPFECCGFGDWRLRAPAVLRRRAYEEAPVMARLPVNLHVLADSGLVILDSIGLAVVQRDTVYGAPSPGTVLDDTSHVHHLTRGDTVRILDYFGEGSWRVRLHGTSDDDMEEFAWHTSATAAIRLVRKPRQHWWAHVTSDAGALAGWLEMDKVSAAGADKCGGDPPSR
jgi:hypothetical protein